MFRFIATLIIVALPAVAAAEQLNDTVSCDGLEDCTEYFLDQDTVDGSFDSAELEQMSARGRLRQVRLIRARTDFVEKMVSSVEDL